MGLRSLVQTSSAKAAKPKGRLPSFKQYREKDGKFYFKFVALTAACCCKARASMPPRKPGRPLQKLQQNADALQTLAPWLTPVDGVTPADVSATLQALADATAA